MLIEELLRFRKQDLANAGRNDVELVDGEHVLKWFLVSPYFSADLNIEGCFKE